MPVDDIYHTAFGVTKSVREWLRDPRTNKHLTGEILIARIKRWKMTPEDILTVPPMWGKHAPKPSKW